MANTFQKKHPEITLGSKPTRLHINLTSSPFSHKL